MVLEQFEVQIRWGREPQNRNYIRCENQSATAQAESRISHLEGDGAQLEGYTKTK